MKSVWLRSMGEYGWSSMRQTEECSRDLLRPWCCISTFSPGHVATQLKMTCSSFSQVGIVKWLSAHLWHKMPVSYRSSRSLETGMHALPFSYFSSNFGVWNAYNDWFSSCFFRSLVWVSGPRDGRVWPGRSLCPEELFLAMLGLGPSQMAQM